MGKIFPSIQTQTKRMFQVIFRTLTQFIDLGEVIKKKTFEEQNKN